MQINNKKNVTTELYEGVLYPVPLIVPNPGDKSKNSDTGEVWFDFNRQDLDQYAEFSGKLNLSALGITSDMLYQSAREHIMDLYSSADILLGDYRYITTTQFKRITISYTVNF